MLEAIYNCVALSMEKFQIHYIPNLSQLQLPLLRHAPLYI